MKLLVPLITVIFTLMLPISSQAGATSSGGGMGVKYKGKVYLYDFLEAGIEDDTFLSTKTPDELGLSKEVSLALFDFDEETVKATVSHINYIAKILPEFAMDYIYDSLKAFQWRLVRPDVHDFEDLGTTFIRKENIPTYAIAARDGDQRVIYVQKEIFNELSLSHRVGLILHEALYANFYNQDSYNARVLNSHLFNRKLPKLDMQHLASLVEVSTIRNAHGFWLTYDQYKFVKSVEYARACVKAKDDVNESLLSSLQVYTDLYNQGMKYLSDLNSGGAYYAPFGMGKYAFLLYSKEISIGSQKVMGPRDDVNVVIPKEYVFSISWENIWGNLKQDIRTYPMDESMRKTIRIGQKTLKEIFKREETDLYARCFARKKGSWYNDPLVITEDFMKPVKGLLNLDANPLQIQD